MLLVRQAQTEAIKTSKQTALIYAAACSQVRARRYSQRPGRTEAGTGRTVARRAVPVRRVTGTGSA